jgi:hypothetical protein
MRKLIATITLVLTFALAGGVAQAEETSTPAGYVPGQLLVRFDGGAEHVLKLPSTVDVPTAERALDANPAVDYAVPNYIAHTSGVPDDPGTAGVPGGWERMQWNFLPCGSLCGESSTPLPFQERGGLNAPGAWDVLNQRGTPAGKGARVAVLDTGVAYMTRKPRFRRSPDFSRKQFLPGYDFVDKDRWPLDEDGHGLTSPGRSPSAPATTSASPASPRGRRSFPSGCSTPRASARHATSPGGSAGPPATGPRSST